MDFINSILVILYRLSLVNKYLVYHFLRNISIILLEFSISIVKVNSYYETGN